MRSLQDEIRQAQRDLFCPICSRTFELKDIRVRTSPEGNSAEISVMCHRGHFPVILLVPITLAEIARAGFITENELKKASKRFESLSNSFQEIIQSK